MYFDLLIPAMFKSANAICAHVYWFDMCGVGVGREGSFK